MYIISIRHSHVAKNILFVQRIIHEIMHVIETRLIRAAILEVWAIICRFTLLGSILDVITFPETV